MFHLKEAKEELDRTIAEIECEPDYDTAALQVAISELYQHLNIAWNGRDAFAERHGECSQSDFMAWVRFPPEPDLFLDFASKSTEPFPRRTPACQLRREGRPGIGGG